MEDLFSDSDHQDENSHPNTLPHAEAIFEKNFNFSTRPNGTDAKINDEKLATENSAAEATDAKLEKRNSSAAEGTLLWTTSNYFNLFFVS